MQQQLLFCGISILQQTTLSVALPYGNNIPIMAIKNCNILILVVLTSYRNEQMFVARSYCNNINIPWP
jgi:hypothetical protein